MCSDTEAVAESMTEMNKWNIMLRVWYLDHQVSIIEYNCCTLITNAAINSLGSVVFDPKNYQ